VPGRFEAVVESALQSFPNRVAVGLDHHAAFDDLSRLGHIALQNNVLIPRGEVLDARRNSRFSHPYNFRLSLFFLATLPSR